MLGDTTFSIACQQNVLSVLSAE